MRVILELFFLKKKKFTVTVQLVGMVTIGKHFFFKSINGLSLAKLLNKKAFVLQVLNKHLVQEKD